MHTCSPKTASSLPALPNISSGSLGSTVCGVGTSARSTAHSLPVHGSQPLSLPLHPHMIPLPPRLWADVRGAQTVPAGCRPAPTPLPFSPFHLACPLSPPSTARSWETILLTDFCVFVSEVHATCQGTPLGVGTQLNTRQMWFLPP